ncbi:hypothetical protein PCANC_02318 [Puccinia coronata f. sp. avenae]|uniref:Uncharacterized protein n=1 Tax=Puccinia coronata f. sp. avenae TaxID=200324 RepID=A0A2N5VZ92_9BASI|nr:hypothetical protein PCANC_02318 [Puccinia coronata f. sp. avenae]
MLGNQSLSQFLLDLRDKGTVEVMRQIKEVCGPRLDNGEAGLRKDAEEFLELLLLQATKRAGEGTGTRLSSEALPYFVVVLPIAVRSGKLLQLFAMAHVDRNGLDAAKLASSYGFIINQLRMSVHETAHLVVAR